MKKVLKCLAAGALVGAVAITASCSDVEDVIQDKNWYEYEELANKNVNVNVHYKNGETHMGVSYRGASQTTGLGGETLQQGSLLPSWVEMETDLGVKISDVANYASDGGEKEWTDYITNGYENSSGKIDLIMADGTYSAKAANQGQLYSIDELMDQGLLPNFKKYLESSLGGITGGIWQSMKSQDGKVYYTPYFAGEAGVVEKNFMMNVDMVKLLLDDDKSSCAFQAYTSDYDTTAAKTSNFTAQVPKMENEKVAVSVNGVKQEITVNYSKSIVTIQNDLSTKNGKTYTEALKQYIDNVYGDYIGKGKIYASRSEIFTSEAACYNADDLIALMRCVQNNPQYLTGTDTIVAMAPRSVAANRQIQILQLASIWGLKGLAGEKEKLYFDKDGKLQDARTDASTYEALDLLHELYNEGLLPEEYYNGYNKTDKSSDSFRKIHMKAGQLFMMYDFNAGTTAFNHDADSTSKTYNFEACMPPVAKWDDGESGENNYFHYTEDVLGLKTGGYCIPKTCTNLEAACRIMDYTWTDKGADLQDYGPNNTYYRNGVTKYDSDGNRVKDNYDAETNPNGATIDLGGKFSVMWSKNVTENSDFIAGWNNFCRQMIGTTHGLGHQRSAGMDIQTTTSLVGRTSFAKLTSAVAAGVLRTAGENTSGIFQMVPSNFAINSSDSELIAATTSTNNIASFWKESGNTTTYYSYWICHGSNHEATKKLYDTFANNFNEVNSIYLTAYRKTLASLED